MPEPNTRADTGGLSARFVVRRTDGAPCRPEARYLVLDGSGADPDAVRALRYYAGLKAEKNPALAADLNDALDGNWPVELAQHADAK